MLNIGVLVSGGGTNLQALLDSISSGKLKDCRISVVISGKAGAYALERARKYNIPVFTMTKNDYASIDEYGAALADRMESFGVQLVVMAGFLSIVSDSFIKRFEGRIINVHPSLIPAFCGKGCYGIIPHRKALEYGVKVTGATVHFVELETDAGPIILQKAVYIKDDDTPETLQKRVMEEAEWQLLPEAVGLFAQGRLSVEGRRVKILDIGRSDKPK